MREVAKWLRLLAVRMNDGGDLKNPFSSSSQVVAVASLQVNRRRRRRIPSGHCCVSATTQFTVCAA